MHIHSCGKIHLQPICFVLTCIWMAWIHGGLVLFKYFKWVLPIIRKLQAISEFTAFHIVALEAAGHADCLQHSVWQGKHNRQRHLWLLYYPLASRLVASCKISTSTLFAGNCSHMKVFQDGYKFYSRCTRPTTMQLQHQQLTHKITYRMILKQQHALQIQQQGKD